jgi:arginyl-tRNA synthetase
MRTTMQSSLNPFAAAALRAVADALDLDADLFAVSAPPRPELGDFAVGCFPAAKALKQAPPRIAAQVAERFQPGELLAGAQAAGPFVNFRANREALYRYLFEATLGQGELVSTAPGQGKTICIDYSSPNISKHLAYHHIRSTVIGHALVNLYRAAGYRVIGINHLGDWGTTHGMLLAAYHRWRDEIPEPLTITALNDLYVRFRQAMKDDPALEHEGRAWFKRLEDGDAEATRLWELFRDVSLAEFQEVYDALGVTFEEVRGESSYLDDVPAVLDLLEKKGLLEISDGALVVRPPEGADVPPMLLRKQDGATLYGTRDLAAAIHRWETYHFERSLYVVGRGQALHFQQLFDALSRAGKEWASRMMHVPFGLVRLGGKMAATRDGNVVLLREVLAEAERRAVAVVEENNARNSVTMSADKVVEIARAVGVGAVVFANLVSQRDKDMDFSWEQVLSTTGDSGPYVQYAHARCASILRRAARDHGAPAPGMDARAGLLIHDLEWALARKLVDLGEVVHRTAQSNEPHYLSRYLLDVCAAFSRWYTAGNQERELRVLVDDEALSRARLTLVAATRHVLARGLGLLGLQAPDSM